MSRRFWRIVDPMVTPQVWAKVREKEKKASAAAVRETGSGARVGKTVAVYCGAAHAECGEWCIQDGFDERRVTYEDSEARRDHDLVAHPLSGRRARIQEREQAEAYE